MLAAAPNRDSHPRLAYDADARGSLSNQCISQPFTVHVVVESAMDLVAFEFALTYHQAVVHILR